MFKEHLINLYLVPLLFICRLIFVPFCASKISFFLPYIHGLHIYIASSQGNQFEFNPNFVYLHTNICSLPCLEDCITHNQGNWSEFNPTFICLHIDLFILHSQLTHFHCTQPRDNLELFVFTKLITMTNCKFDLTCVKLAKGNYFGCKTLNAWVHRYGCVGAQKWHLMVINDPLINILINKWCGNSMLLTWHDVVLTR